MPDVVRKLASIRKIAKVEPIPKADRIVKITVDGWELVTQKSNGFVPGDLVVYFEVDSFLPIEEKFSFLEPYKKVMDGKEGYRLKTIKLRGQVSQGLVLPMADLFEVDDGGAFEWCEDESHADGKYKRYFREGDDVTEDLGVTKYEKPEVSTHHANSDGSRSRGNFPSFIPKTDQDRVQNCLERIKMWIFMGESNVTEVTEPDMIYALNEGRVMNTIDSYYFKSGELWFHNHRLRNDEETVLARSMFEVSLKLDGSSITVYHNDQSYGVCSRNLELKRDMASAFWATTNGLYIIPDMIEDGRNVAIQGELMGPGVQGNREKFTHTDIYAYDVYDIDLGRYMTPDERRDYLYGSLNGGINHVPIFDDFQIRECTEVAELLAMADRASINHPVAEGLVFKSKVPGGPSFKAINNKYLLDEE